MNITNNVSLSKMTTFRMGGIARELYSPKEIADLSEIPLNDDDRYLIISKGSNLLIDDRATFNRVVSMRSFDREIQHLGDGVFRVGAGATIQSFITYANSLGYGDIEELISIPGLVGGLVAMNASVPSAGVCISDHLHSVEAFRDGQMMSLLKDKCDFGYRRSFFLDGKSIIAFATFLLPTQSIDKSEFRRSSRMKHCASTQDRSRPNYGSVFSKCSPKIMSFARAAHLKNGGISFSEKTPNWMVNDGGNFTNAISIIRKVETMHRLLGRKCELEVRIWQ